VGLELAVVYPDFELIVPVIADETLVLLIGNF